MTDTQILTLALSLVIPLAVLLLSNSRLTDMRSMLQASIIETRESLQNSLNEAKETLRAEMNAKHTEQMALLHAVMGKLDELDARLTKLER